MSDAEKEIREVIARIMVATVGFCVVSIALMSVGVPVWKLGDWLHTPMGLFLSWALLLVAMAVTRWRMLRTGSRGWTPPHCPDRNQP